MHIVNHSQVHIKKVSMHLLLFGIQAFGPDRKIEHAYPTKRQIIFFQSTYSNSFDHSGGLGIEVLLQSTKPSHHLELQYL